MQFLLNQRSIDTDRPEGMVVLDFLRQEQQLIGTRAACREGDCGACLVLLGELRHGRLHYRPVNSCLLPLGRIAGRHIVTIEGVSGHEPNPLQQALVSATAIQCGFCSPGLVMALTAFLLNTQSSSPEEAIEAVSGNLCRCTGYMGIKRALRDLCNRFDLGASSKENRLADLIEWRLLPSYFNEIPQHLAELDPTPASNMRQGVKVAGGTDLFVQRPQQLLQQTLVFLPEQETIELQGNECRIGAGTRIETLRQSGVMRQLFPAIGENLKLICSTPVRQQATVGGNLVNASPIGDMSVFLLALDASLTIASTATLARRDIPLRKFFQGYKRIDLQSDEKLADIRFRCPEKPLRFSFEKVSKRTYLDIASVNSAMSLEIKERVLTKVHISAGGVAAIPLYLHQTAEFLQGKSVSADVIKQALALAQQEISPIADSRGSIAYKRLLLRQLLIAHFLKLLPDSVTWEDLR
ncbi:FAD binding domain-containing protein [Methylomarinum vadi]|uniref:FAD binding domain-containing protein n=1 Tax=Methylomarinum vadi TaxID=438855 RepID=UPI0004DF7E66|nr:FAD binding domain-containing protein [Methylomarinum vadi]